MYSLCILPVLLVISAGFKGGDMDVAVRAIVQAERDFDKAAGEKGTHDAFLHFLSDDAILFRPGPVHGKPWLEGQEPGKGRLTWYPVYADMSRGCNFGYTTGPWQFFADAGSVVAGAGIKPDAFGYYVTVWTRQGDGPWRVAIDCGVSGVAPLERGRGVAGPAFGRHSASLPKITNSNPAMGNSGTLMAAEREYAKLAAEDQREAMRKFAAGDIRLMRSAVRPAIGARAALKAVAARRNPEPLQEPERAVVAPAGDLGYTYGRMNVIGSDGSATQVGYMRIWTRAGDGGWRIVLDVW